MNQYQLMERLIRLESIVKSLVEANNTTDAIKELLSPFCEKDGWIQGCSAAESWEWDEEHIFNEARLYKALGKDDARSVLGVWRRFRDICELLSTIDKEV